MSDEDFGKQVAEWYSENIDRFPDLVSGECEYCGETEMIVRYDSGHTSCYFCGDTAEVTIG